MAATAHEIKPQPETMPFEQACNLFLQDPVTAITRLKQKRLTDAAIEGLYTYWQAVTHGAEIAAERGEINSNVTSIFDLA